LIKNNKTDKIIYQRMQKARPIKRTSITRGTTLIVNLTTQESLTRQTVTSYLVSDVLLRSEK